MNIKNKVNFVVEQNGVSEREFKNALIPILSNHDEPVRAYLVQTTYDENNIEFNVALCFMVEDKEDVSLLSNSMKIFKSMFGAKEHLDIIFLNREQEKAIRKISCPFYTSKNYQIKIPDFYLTSSEGYGLNHPIACFKRKHLLGKHPDGYLLCDIQPALIGQSYGLDSKNIEQLVLANRHQGYSLFPIYEWPAYVHIALPLLDMDTRDHIGETDIKLIAWGELYLKKPDAAHDQKNNYYD